MIRKIAFTVYAVRDMDRARDFYEKGLGLPLGDVFENAWVEYNVGDEVFAITSWDIGLAPANNAGGTIAFEVDDVDALTASLRERGATVKMEPFSTPVCRMATVLDPDGNGIILHKLID